MFLAHKDPGLSKGDTYKAERFFKSGYGREVLKDKLKNYFSGIV